ncbi:hypothetical protein ATANTOWER_018141 [Ataeniobius toweri]|uniref:Uncharacterized protein n=1 Tax=Ataeniobius toweri TaxID=208326 RepID=A0ABU7BJC6_9TELE|nr:hypothetical protein [Ataeniobius toweri]
MSWFIKQQEKGVNVSFVSEQEHRIVLNRMYLSALADLQHFLILDDPISSYRPPLHYWSGENRKLKLQFPQAHQSWSVTDWKNLTLSPKSHFQLQHSHCSVY